MYTFCSLVKAMLTKPSGTNQLKQTAGFGEKMVVFSASGEENALIKKNTQ